MQISTAKIFSSVKKPYLLTILLTAVLIATLASESVSFYKLQKLQNQKEIAATVHKLSRSDLDLANIKYRGSISLLKNESKLLRSLYEYDYINNFTKKFNYRNELNKLDNSIKDFEEASAHWFGNEAEDEAQLAAYQKSFDTSYIKLREQINNIVSQNIQFEEQRFYVELGLSVLLFLLLLINYFSTSRKLASVEEDIQLLKSSEGAANGIFSTSDAEFIAKQLGRATKSTTVATPPQNIDSVSGINNYKGFMHECASKKSQSLGNYVAICIFSIDHFNELEAQNSSEFSEAIVKKVAFMLSLYRQHNDVIGRLDHNKFAFYLSRADKATALHECELVRQSVEETAFKTDNGTSIHITLSGGFVQKSVTQSFEEVVTKASKVLTMSIKHGGNRIAQLRDKSAIA